MVRKDPLYIFLWILASWNKVSTCALIIPLNIYITLVILARQANRMKKEGKNGVSNSIHIAMSLSTSATNLCKLILINNNNDLHVCMYNQCVMYYNKEYTKWAKLSDDFS